MAEIIHFGQYIDAEQLRHRNRKLPEGVIRSSMVGVVGQPRAANHVSDPIKDMRDIERISDWCIEHGRYRDNMLFIVGINFGLRVSDLLELRFCDLINDNLTFKDTFPVFEIKTRNTRKRKRNRYITINEAVVEAVTLYLEKTPNVSLGDYLFKNQSGNSTGENVPMDRRSVNRIMDMFKEKLDLTMKVSSHTLRKTFGYHQMVMGGNDPRQLLLLQKIFGHKSAAQTLDYIGITEEEIASAYKQLNLGSKEFNYLARTKIIEEAG